MRAYLASAVGVVCTAALTLPLTNGQGVAAAPHAASRAAPVSAALPGSTQSLPLSPLTPPAAGPDRANTEPEYGMEARTVRPFSLVGVVWDDAAADLHGHVQVRTRATGTERWSDWQDLETHRDDAPDLDAGTRRGEAMRGSTAPLWVGDSDGVQVRIEPEQTSRPGEGASSDPGPAPDQHAASNDHAASHHHAASSGQLAGVAPPLSSGQAAPTATPARLPKGLHLELVNPGDAPTGHSVPPMPQSPTDPPAPDAQQPPADEHSPADEQPPADEHSPADEQPPADEEPPADEQPPADEHPPTDEQPSADEQPPADEQPSENPEGPAAVDGPLSRETTTDALVLDPTRSVPGDLVLPEENEEETAAQRTWQRPHVGQRPRIILRKGWGADERLRERKLKYTRTVKAAFVHHSATGNNYRCSQAPSVIRSIYRYHVKSSGWRDLGYNFIIDRCGNIYEGRAGGPAKPVLGAHTLGFNIKSTGIAVLGTHSRATPSKAVVRAVAKLTAWKLGLHGRNPLGSTVLVSGGSNKYRKGTPVRLKVISGHRDGFTTDCPGARLYTKLGAIRSAAAKLQGR
ncbi:peptidoglycan recognition protein family protein [Streptomyces zagrosensis]|uniref:Peptidoglycan recognition protein family domain-containing protein n=1 Tax=Streptomyces zagrosensis TaxID=1042984 RepID=A0A7W9V1D8_9ACTN|nr:peptidoglycan recognition protein [Streptomyces zagrosensis]MBB5939090.1 hypothetical protein [Streptomyces zagrosensis]